MPSVNLEQLHKILRESKYIMTDNLTGSIPLSPSQAISAGVNALIDNINCS